MLSVSRALVGNPGRGGEGGGGGGGGGARARQGEETAGRRAGDGTGERWEGRGFKRKPRTDRDRL